MGRIRLLPTIMVKILLICMYRLFCIACKLDERMVTFASYRSEELNDNLAFVSAEMTRQAPELRQVYLFKKMDRSFMGKLIYIFHMIRACYHLATSRYFIIDDFYFPIYVIKPRAGVEIIQLWHSAGALKKFGLSTVGKPYGPSEQYLKLVNIHGNYTKAFVSSTEVIPYYAEAFAMEPANILPLGIPRTDYFFDQEKIAQLKEDFYKSYPELVGKKIILYAPTFRGKSHHQDLFELPFDEGQMERELGDDYVLLIHLHPYMHAKLSVNAGFTYLIRGEFSIMELLVMTDVLITDYSTVFFDFSLLGRPIIFYPYDLQDYMDDRDFYYDYEKIIPGPMAAHTNELVTLIKNEIFDKRKLEKFRNRFFDIQDGRATERIVKNILGVEAEKKRKVL